MWHSHNTGTWCFVRFSITEHMASLSPFVMVTSLKGTQVSNPEGEPFLAPLPRTRQSAGRAACDSEPRPPRGLLLGTRASCSGATCSPHRELPGGTFLPSHPQGVRAPPHTREDRVVAMAPGCQGQARV